MAVEAPHPSHPLEKRCKLSWDGMTKRCFYGGEPDDASTSLISQNHEGVPYKPISTITIIASCPRCNFIRL